MTDPAVLAYERDVEIARRRLANDLARLRSPHTMSSFTADVKREAFNAKDALVEQAKSSTQSAIHGLVEDLKAKAAANPAALLCIGAGLAWRFIQRPPIASALVGAGILALLRSEGRRSPAGMPRDYLAEGKERLKEQAADFASGAKQAAVQAGDAVAAKAGDLFDTAKDKATQWTSEARQSAAQASEAVADTVRSTTDNAVEGLKGKVREWSATTRQTSDQVMSGAEAAAGNLGETAQQLSHDIQAAASDAYDQSRRVVRDTIQTAANAAGEQDTRDKLLLGIAGLAVAAAMGIAARKQMHDVDG